MIKVQANVFCWPTAERMHRIHQLILNGDYPNCHPMAKSFETSWRLDTRAKPAES